MARNLVTLVYDSTIPNFDVTINQPSNDRSALCNLSRISETVYRVTCSNNNHTSENFGAG